MPLTRDQKADAVGVIQEQLEAKNTVYVTDYKGLTVEQVNDLRNRFRDAGVDYKVVKNTLLRLAMDRIGGYDDFFAFPHGRTDVELSYEPVALVKVIKKILEDVKAELTQM